MVKARGPRGSGARIATSVVGAAVVSSSILLASVTGTLSSFTASIQNSTNTTSSGSVVMKETDESGNTVCLSTDGNSSNSATCGTINKYGAVVLSPGATGTVTKVKIANLGTSAVNNFTLVPGSCTEARTSMSVPASSGHLCSKVKLTVTCAIGAASPSTVISAMTLSSPNASYDVKALSSGACVPSANGANEVTFSFSLTMDSDADSTVQNQTATQPLTWTFNA